MQLSQGFRLGAYEILSAIGAGGMGEVYKARDPKLNRMVAVKILPAAFAADGALVARFEREARAVAALSHPNVLGIFDLGTQDGLAYAVMELLEGESLREKLKGGALQPRRALEIAVDLAGGLGAAHARGIVHRDIKPENIFITREGRVKILDFGLAKLVPASRGGPAQDLETMAMDDPAFATEAGMVLGTVGYMSPEQVRGDPADHRSDIFAFGVVLFEMLTGRRPFGGQSAVQTMAAILEQDPPPLASPRGPLPPALERVVGHCLEKHPEGRFQSTQDIVFALQNLSTLSGPAHRAGAGRRLPPAFLQVLWGFTVALGALVLAWTLGLPPFRPPAPPTFTRLNHTPGTVEAAFFGPDGKTVYLSQRLQGGPPEVFVLRPGSAEPTPLGLSDALLLGVSASGDLALLRHPQVHVGLLQVGTLAQAGGEGGPVRDVRKDVVDAAWDGRSFVTLTDEHRTSITFTFAGHGQPAWDPRYVVPRFLRPAFDGSRVALVLGDIATGRTSLVAFDRDGRRKVLFEKEGDSNGASLTGLAWAPDGSLWFSEVQGDQTALWRLPRRGARRLLWRGEGDKALMDVAQDGQVLLADQQVRRGVLVIRPGQGPARDLSIAGGTQALGFSSDGRSLLLVDSPSPSGGTPQDQAYIWNPEVASATRVARSQAMSLSQDGQWVNVWPQESDVREVDPQILEALHAAHVDPRRITDNTPEQGTVLIFVPTGAGQAFARELPAPFIDSHAAQPLADGRTLLFQGLCQGQSSWFKVDRDPGEAKPVGPLGYGTRFVGLAPLAPDESRLIVGTRAQFFIQDLAGGDPRPLRGLGPDDRPMGWCQDLKGIYIRTGTLPVQVNRLDLATGERRPVFTYSPGDASGLVQVRAIHTTPDARLFALSYLRELSNLYRVGGLKP